MGVSLYKTCVVCGWMFGSGFSCPNCGKVQPEMDEQINKALGKLEKRAEKHIARAKEEKAILDRNKKHCECTESIICDNCMEAMGENLDGVGVSVEQNRVKEHLDDFFADMPDQQVLNMISFCVSRLHKMELELAEEITNRSAASSISGKTATCARELLPILTSALVILNIFEVAEGVE